MPDQGDYRCHPTLGGFKIMLGNPGTAEALSMSASGRFILLISGLTVAVYVMWPETGAEVTVPPDQERQEDRGSNPESSGKSALSQPEKRSFSFIEPTVVTIVQQPVKRSVALGRSPLPLGRDAIGRELQKELKRVGCYAGQLNGAWTKSTRHAMNAFTDRVNAKLPTDQPDSILLALVQAYPNKVCGIPCPSGQSLSRTQECTPEALLARSSGRKLTAARDQRLAKVTSGWTLKTTAMGGGFVPPAGTEPPGPAAIVEPPSSSAVPPQGVAPHRVVKRHWQPPARHEGGWASNFLKHRDRLSLNQHSPH